jgi:hypothetical protein
VLALAALRLFFSTVGTMYAHKEREVFCKKDQHFTSAYAEFTGSPKKIPA